MCTGAEVEVADGIVLRRIEYLAARLHLTGGLNVLQRNALV